MFSLKDSIRRAITVTIASALATAVFVGCSGKDPINSQELTSTVIDQLTPGIIDNSDVGGFSIKYKYWYENADVAEAQSNHLAATVTDAAKSTGLNFLNLDGLPIYKDSEGNQYIISGRIPVYMLNGKIALKDFLYNLRTAEGNRLYYFTEDKSDNVVVIDSQPETYEERVSNSDSDLDIQSEYAVYINNVNTGDTYYSTTGRLNITNLLSSMSLGLWDSDSSTLILYTAAGAISIEISNDGYNWTLKYSTEEGEQTADADALDVYSNGVSMTLQAIEDLLGYDVEVYDEYINIVTDNKDIITEDSLLPRDSIEFADASLNGADTSKPLNTADNQQAIDDYNNAVKQHQQDELDKLTQQREENGKPQPDRNLAPEDSNDGNASKPDVKTTPDGKYTIAPTDLQNSDGTLTQQLGTGDPSDVTVPAACTAHNACWTAESAARRKGQSNPSKIPYSDITVENAAEAFPYLGYIGYSPDYIEILPTDTPERIEFKIWNNLVGTNVQRFYGGYADPNEMPSHCFSSEAEYKAWVKECEEARAEADRRHEQAKQNIEDGNYTFGDLDDNRTEEEQKALDDALASIFGF